jgi:hypothetical protein
MREVVWTVWLAGALAVGSALPSLAQTAPVASCGERANFCEAVCTPERIRRLYAGSAQWCSASCEPRWQQCLRTRTWVHLEGPRAGLVESVDRW